MKLISDVHEIQNLILPVLLYIDRICKEYNIRYSLGYGTLIGAIRHKGFIPWDDDVDILMPRKDYLRFTEVIKNHQNIGFLDISCLDNFYAGRIAKVFNKQTVLREYTDEYNLEYGAFVDIFVVNGVGDTYLQARNKKNIIHKYGKVVHAYISSKYKKRGIRKKFSWILKYFAKFALSRINKVFDEFNTDTSIYGINYEGGPIDTEIIKLGCFDDLIDVEFEGYSFKAFREYDKYLKRIYGDYMQLPPIEQQKSNHSFSLYNLSSNDEQ